MAKPRKPKNDDNKQPDSTGPIVRHQKLCLSVDIDNRRVYRYTELKIVVPEIGIVGIHAENIGIDSVLVDGEQTEYEYYPHSVVNEAESLRKWSWVNTPSLCLGFDRRLSFFLAVVVSAAGVGFWRRIWRGCRLVGF